MIFISVFTTVFTSKNFFISVNSHCIYSSKVESVLGVFYLTR